MSTPDADKANIAFSGTFVGSGRGSGVVIATGARTALGEINALVQGPQGKTPLQLLTHSLERKIGLVVLAALVFVFIAWNCSWATTYPLCSARRLAWRLRPSPNPCPSSWRWPSGLGVSATAKRNAIIRTLPAVETLGIHDGHRLRQNRNPDREPADRGTDLDYRRAAGPRPGIRRRPGDRRRGCNRSSG